MKMRASAQALLLFLLSGEDVIPENVQDNYSLTVYDTGEGRQSIESASFEVYSDPECQHPLLKDDEPLIIKSGDDGSVSFYSSLDDCYLIAKDNAGYYQNSEPYHLKQGEDGEIGLDPVYVRLAEKEDNLSFQFKDGEETAAYWETGTSPSVKPGKTYTLIASRNDDKYTRYEETLIEIPSTKPDEPVVVALNSYRTGQLNLTSADPDLQAEYRLYKDEACEEELTDEPVKLDEAGRADLFLKEGTYYLRQEKTGNEYFPDEKIERIEIREGTDTPLQLISKPARFVIHMYDETTHEAIDVPMKDGETEYYSNTPAVLSRGSRITLIPDQAGSQYVLPEKIEVVMDENAVQDVELDFALKPVTGTPVIDEQKEDPSPSDPLVLPQPVPVIQPASLQVNCMEETAWSLYLDPACTLTASDANGAPVNSLHTGMTASLNNGTYYLKADTVPAGYYFPAAIPVTVTGADLTVPLDLKKASLTVNCIDQSESDQAVIIGLFDSNGTLMEKWPAADTKVIENGIMPGSTYYLKVLGTDSSEIVKAVVPTDEEAGPSAVSLHLPAAGLMQIEVGNEDRKAADMTYAVYGDSEMKNMVTTIKTDSSGKASADLNAGTYYLKPVDVPKHWYEDDEAIEVRAGQNEKVTKIVPQEVTVMFHLRNTDGEYVAGSSLALLDADGKTVYEWTSGKEAMKISDSALERGAVYILHEKRSASGYRQLEDQEIKIPEAASAPLTIQITKEKKGSVQKIVDGSDEKETVRRYGLIAAGCTVILMTAAGLVALKKSKKYVRK